MAHTNYLVIGPVVSSRAPQLNRGWHRRGGLRPRSVDRLLRARATYRNRPVWLAIRL